MKLQKYDLWVDAHRVEIVADADNDFGTWVKASDADALEKENAALRDEITSLRVQLGAIGELVKDRVNTSLEIE
jgi:hypothetical protein